MSGLFKVGAKLLGIYQLYLTLSSASQLFVVRLGVAVPVVPTVLILLLLSAFSFALIFNTDWIASQIGADNWSEPISSRSFLKAGIILVGLSFFLTRAGVLVTYFIFSTALSPFSVARSPSQLIAEMVLLLVSLGLVFGSEQIVQLLEKYGGWEKDAG